jgi:two-component system nitrate/nitrite response regulator NarL
MNFLIVDEHPLLREALKATLGQQFPAAEISTVESHDDARETMLRRPADLVITNLICGHPEHLRSLPELVGATAPGRVVVFGNCFGHIDAMRAQAAGVHGYIPATSRPELVGAAIGLVLAGGAYFPQPGSADTRSTSNVHGPLVKRLTRRQQEVLRGLQVGQSNKEIAGDLDLSIATVKLHVQSILRLTGVHNRAHAVAFAADHPDILFF